jgi:hypothetical protein
MPDLDFYDQRITVTVTIRRESATGPLGLSATLADRTFAPNRN